VPFFLFHPLWETKLENVWPNDLHAENNPAFYEDAQSVELPELTWHDAEALSDAASEQDIVVPVAEPEPEPETAEEKAQREASERAQRIRKAERAFERTTYDAKLRNRKRSDAAMDAELASGTIQCLDRHRVCFQKVTEQYTSLIHRSGLKVQKYEDVGKGSRKTNTDPNRIDFLADVESVAKRALKSEPKLLRVFLNQMASEFDYWADVPGEIRTQIENQCGWWFTRAGMHPSQYWE
jgi:hypothetical protein